MNDRRYLLVCHDAGGTVPPMLALEEQLERSLPAIVGASVGDDLLRVAQELRPAAVVIDANLSGALAAAERLQLPSVVMLHSMYKTFVDVWFGELWPLLVTPINETRVRFGVSEVRGWNEIFSRHTAAMSVVTSSFDAPVEEPLGNLKHFGFLVPHEPTATPELPAGDKPLALVSLSTTFQGQERLLDAIVEGAARYARLFVTTGGYGAIDTADAGVTVNNYVPHSAVLRDVDLVITHGGLGTIAAALAYGTPLVCAPMGRDQNLNTERVETAGVGVGVSPLASPHDIAAAVERVLGDHTFADAARRQAATSDVEGGPAAAAAYLAGLGS
jgi:UDP:flavonoid glycosyltransferase YjiC (YdhE family)